MKRLIVLIICFLPVLSTLHAQQGVLIGKKEGTPNPFAKLEVYSTSSGLLIPRMTAEERDNINPDGTAISLLVFDISDSTFYFFNGIDWEKMGSGRDIDIITETLDTVNAKLQDLEESLVEALMVDSVWQLPAEGRNSGDVVIVEDNGEGYRETFVWSDSDEDGEPDRWVGVTVRPRVSGYNVYWFEDDMADALVPADFTNDKVAASGSNDFDPVGYAINVGFSGNRIIAFPENWGSPAFYIGDANMYNNGVKYKVRIDGISYQAWAFYLSFIPGYTGPAPIFTAVK